MEIDLCITNICIYHFFVILLENNRRYYINHKLSVILYYNIMGSRIVQFDFDFISIDFYFM